MNLKKTLDGISSKMEMTKERVSEVKDRSTGIIQSEQHTEKKKYRKKNVKSFRDL